MLLSKNRIKYLASLKIKKFRTLHQQFILEGEKAVRDALGNNTITIDQIIATPEWWLANNPILTGRTIEIAEAKPADMKQISSLETPPPVMAILNIPGTELNLHEVAGSLSLALDNIQDPGNMGTIIRTADWFGIRNIFCSEGCADIYNPKVVQASMGAILHVKVHYIVLHDLLGKHIPKDLEVIGTFMEGKPVAELETITKGLILFGNESKGISNEYLPYIRHRVTIPPSNVGIHVESLNVASSVAIVLSTVRRNIKNYSY